MSYFIIGDVHGCLHELQEMITLLNPSDKDTLVFAGDLVDRGPDSVGVIRYVRSLPNAILVQGNHEDKHKRYRKALLVDSNRAHNMNKHSAKQGSPLEEITDSLSEEDVEWLDSAIPFYSVSEFNIKVVHGGVTPKMETFPETLNDLARLSNRDKKRLHRTMYVRTVDPNGSMVKLGEESDHCDFWAKVYDGRFGHIVYGHTAYYEEDEPVRHAHATGIDLGCCYGNYLCALVIGYNGRISHKTIKAKRPYASPRIVC